MCFQSCFSTTKCQEGVGFDWIVFPIFFYAEFSEFLSFQNSLSPGKKVSKSRRLSNTVLLNFSHCNNENMDKETKGKPIVRKPIVIICKNVKNEPRITRLA